MIRLQKKEPHNIQNGSLEELEKLSTNSKNFNFQNTENVETIIPQKQNNLESFSNEVLRLLIEKNIPPLPANYQTFFEQLLNDYDLDFQKKIHDLMEVDLKNDERNINFEKNIHLAFSKIKDLLKCTSSIYKNLAIINEHEKKVYVQNTGNKKILDEISTLQNVVDKQIIELKALYQQCNKILDNININTMYDSKFDVYNKRYFIKSVQEEAKSVQKFKHTSTILMMSLTHSVIMYLRNEQMAIIVMKTVAKLLLKTSRRSDMIGYIGNGIFGMLLKHSDIISSKKASERLVELIKNTNIFLSNKEINLDINIGIAKIIPQRSAEDSLNYAISALRLSQNNQVEYLVYKEDAE